MSHENNQTSRNQIVKRRRISLFQTRVPSKSIHQQSFFVSSKMTLHKIVVYAFLVKNTKVYSSKENVKKGQLLQHQWMLGGIERTKDSEILFFVEMIEDRTESTIIPIIQRRIRNYKKIISDGLNAYSTLEVHDYIHEVVIHDDNFEGQFLSYVLIQNTENMWLVLEKFFTKKRHT
ncbi:hypothetical protein RF11_12100 [Thelohanellus kitauei]|uniref:ISXO2-like transposase domain-containing protein n=1 Tax=Thelohanellus kitauei TaxID=669202 RepID=A0A0C2J7S7_THEKT|nr:hypothetical protein RF11_12100 [Thelohanellus kitauei]